MVNETALKIKQITEILKTSDKPVSGEVLAEKLGVSRTAIWKIISRLKQRGYRIESSRAGYRMVSATDKPVPWELGAVSGPVEYHDELDSTMEKAAAVINSGCSDGTVIIAGSQTGGLNREGGRWESPDGGLYLTRIRTAHFPSLYSGLYTVAMSAAVAGFLREGYGIEAFVDWPGGIACGDGKLGGLITYFRGDTDTVVSAALGIGLNIRCPDSLPADASSLDTATGTKVSIKTLTSGLLEVIENADSRFPEPDIETAYGRFLKQKGLKASADIPGKGIINGVITGLHESGAMIFDSGDGNHDYIFSGTRIFYE